MNFDTVRKTFTVWAPFYNPTHSWTLPKRRAARLALDIQPGDRVLDIACGTALNFLTCTNWWGSTVKSWVWT
jgi:ubiquinone/menaquinone biosynthesis C-methylase UbiE